MSPDIFPTPDSDPVHAVGFYWSSEPVRPTHHPLPEARIEVLGSGSGHIYVLREIINLPPIIDLQAQIGVIMDWETFKTAVLEPVRHLPAFYFHYFSKKNLSE